LCWWAVSASQHESTTLILENLRIVAGEVQVENRSCGPNGAA